MIDRLYLLTAMLGFSVGVGVVVGIAEDIYRAIRRRHRLVRSRQP